MTKKQLFLFPVIYASVYFVTSISHATEIQYCFPVQPKGKTSFSKGGHSYPATDIFAKRNIAFVAPVPGLVEDINVNDEWNNRTNYPDKRGGRWVSILGDDGFRYYGSHLESVCDKISVGQRVESGCILGYLGNSGNAKGKTVHLHFGISSATRPYSWKTRRGEIEPYDFLRCILKQGCKPETFLTKEKTN
ncbi:MAG: M23 family metallopeptidase [Syntrophaceae bacterium]|nr:M23 family metallopeptidase [Syntrophaceae bacterium]